MTEPDTIEAVLRRAAKYAESEALGRPYRRGVSERASADTFALRELASLVKAYREAGQRRGTSAERDLLACLRGASTPTETKERER